ncbi:MAG TPA: hypothetical protein VFH73_20875 [Polyangia bacterium]|jgi:mono/diheme cytochrome c family protein|nr:hypothetical protein [Polyangia bacterium]
MTTTAMKQRLLGTVILALIAALPGLGCKGKYIRPVTDEKVPATPEATLRGSYLVNNVMSCGGCHTSRENGSILTDPEKADAFLGGSGMTDPDLDAVVAYLKSVPAAKYQVPERQLAAAAKKAAGE